MRLFIVLIFCWLTLSTGSYGQTDNVPFEHLSTKEGLSHSIVTCTLQDKEGFMWIGTQDGLNRFDGYTFRVFEHDPNDKTSISNNTIKCLYEDQAGTIWVGTRAGVNKFDKRTNTFQVYRHESANANSLSSDHIRAIYEDQSRTLWIGTYAGLDKFDPKTHTFTLYEHEPGHPDKWQYNEITKIYEDRQGNFWVGTNRGISRFDRKSLRFTRYLLPTIASDDMDPQHSIRDILEDRTGVLWVATTGDGLASFDRKTSRFTVYLPNSHDPHSSIHIMTLYEDSFGTLWIGTQDKGVCRFDQRKKRFIPTPLHSPLAYSRNTITSIYEDRAKVLWVGTYEEGVYKLDLLRKKFTHVFHAVGSINTIRKNDVTALFEDRTRGIWIANGAGLDKLDKCSGEYSYYDYPNPTLNNLWQNNAQCIYEDKNGHVWVGLLGGGLKKINRKTRQCTSYFYTPGDSTGLPNGIVNTIHQDKQGGLWLGTRFGLARFDEKTQKFTTYRPSFVSSQQIDISKIIEDRAGKLWLSADQYGLLTFDPQTGSFVQYSYRGASLQRTTKAIHNLFEDRTGRLWMCLNDGGLVYMDRKTGTFQSVMEPNVLTKTVIMGILEDEKGNLWLSTSKNGLYKFNPATKTLAIYDALDGLQDNEFSTACFKSQSGEMYFGGKSGFNFFHPDSILSNPYAPPVVISSFKVLDKPRSVTREVQLAYNENFLSFDFVALSYAFPNRNSYAYKLEGFDEDWVSAGARRYASFTNLAPGEYVFRVKAANHDGTWNSQGAAISIRISPPIWKTTAAYFLYAALFIGAIAGLRRYIISQERLKNTLLLSSLESEKLLELDQLKSRFFTSISHEFRTPLTLILSPLERNLSSAQKGRFAEPEVRLMHRNAKRLLELINQLLDISKLEAKKMPCETTLGDMMPLLKATVFSFQSFAESKLVRLTFESQLASLITVFDKDKLEKIVTNLLANALKFTPQGEVKVGVSIKNTAAKPWIVIEVRDTGIGIPTDRIGKIFDRFYQVDSSHTREFEGSGIGLTLTKELVELQQGTIRATSTVGEGSCFTVELPLVEVVKETLLPEYQISIQSTQPIQAASEESVLRDESLPEEADEQAPLLLIVEDNTDLRAYMRAVFQPQYRILEASNGQQGWELAQETMPDLIVTDWMMPKMDGVQLCHHIKTDERTSHVPLILLTAKATVQSKMEGLETGADDYITKPFHTEELVVRAKNLIAQRKSLRERWSKAFALAPADAITSPQPISALTTNAVDERFLQRVIGVIEANLGDSDFTIESLEKEVGMSHTNLYSKLKALTNQSPSEFVRYCRLQKAAVLLMEYNSSVSEVAFQVGFAHLSYFTKCFRQLYGTTPSQYVRRQPKRDLS